MKNVTKPEETQPLLTAYAHPFKWCWRCHYCNGGVYCYEGDIADGRKNKCPHCCKEQIVEKIH